MFTSCSSREKAQSAKTLICLLQTLIAETVTIELRDDSQVKGRIASVDGFMNIELEEVILKKPVHYLAQQFNEQRFDYLLIKGPRIRYVHLPDHLDVIKSTEEGIKQIQSVHERKVESIKATKSRSQSTKSKGSNSQP